MTALLLLTGALATWRVSHMLLRENGPFRIFRRIRVALGVRYGQLDEDTVIAYEYEITTCIWCLSMWVGGIVSLLIYTLQDYALYLLLPYAFSAITVVIDQHFGQES